MRASGFGMSDDRTSRSLSLTTGGITLLVVLLSVSVSVAFGISAARWIRVLAGMVTLVVLTVAVKWRTAAGRGPLARLARWMIGPGGNSTTARKSGGAAARSLTGA